MNWQAIIVFYKYIFIIIFINIVNIIFIYLEDNGEFLTKFNKKSRTSIFRISILKIDRN